MIAFIERLRVPSGKGAGRPFKLRAWQRDFIWDVYAYDDDDGARLTRMATLSMARKNGKTALIAALVLVHLVGPEAKLNNAIVSAANDKEQAGQVFLYLTQIIEQSPTLRSTLRIIHSRKRVVYDHGGSVYAALSADANRKHGLNPAVVIYDELAQSKNRDLYDALETAQGAQDEPLFIVISTQSHDPQHPLSQLIDDGLKGEDETTIVHLYAVPDDVEDVFDEQHWYDANPGLADFRSLVELRKYAERARRLPSFENTLRNLYLNQRVSNLTTLFTRSVWQACAAPTTFQPRDRVYLALDYATRVDLAALVMLKEEDLSIRAFFWKPEDLMDEHGRRDRVDYEAWLRQGFMEPCPGRVVRGSYIATKIGELYGEYDVVAMAYDRWRIDQIKDELDAAGIAAGTDENSPLRLVPWGQGYKDMAPALDALEERAITRELRHESNPVLTWNIGNAIVDQDAAGNRKLDKEKSRLRIDGAQALAMAAGLYSRMMEEGAGPSIYETRGVVTL